MDNRISMAQALLSFFYSARSGHWRPRARQLLAATVILWAVPILVVAVMVALHPLKRSVTPLYHQAARNWWAGENLYSGPKGMNYFPHFAILFSPFHLLPYRVADIVWRLCAAAMLGCGLWQVLRTLFASERERPLLWATVIAMPLSMSALRNGQANAVFAGLTLLAISAVINRKWWPAVGLMALATAIKPLGIVLLLLAPLVYSPLRWRSLVAIIGFLIFPFLFSSPEYVISQYRETLANLQACAVVTEHRFADVNGILRTFGTAFSPGISTIIRVAAGLFTACLWWLGAKRLSEALAGLWLYALATSYLMLFNPMNEQNSFVILAPAMGLWGAFFLLSPNAVNQRRLGWWIVFMALSMALLPNALRPLFGNRFALFWHPTMTIVFLGMLIKFVWTYRVPSLADPLVLHATTQ